jgi:hypothetical protein
MVTLQITLPDELARDAREFDLLQEAQIVQLLQAELDRRVMELVNAEVHAYRAEKTFKNH